MHAEFESECKKKIEQLTNAVKDPSSWDASLPPAAVQANAQPEPLASKWDPISSSGGAEPCTSQMARAVFSEKDAHLPLPDVNDKPLARPPPSPIEKTGGSEPIASKIDTAHSV